MRGKRYFIIGDGAAGTTAARTLRQGDETGQITLVSDDPHPAYYRAALTNYLLGELRDEQLWATPPSFYSQFRVERVLSRVVRVDPSRKEVWLSQGTAEPYDELLVASGSRARQAPYQKTQRGILTFRTLADARHIVETLSTGKVKEAVIVGAGPLGLEWALGLHTRGIRVSVLIREDAILTSILDRVASDLLVARLKQAGVQIHSRAEVREATTDKDGWVSGVVLTSGHTIKCQLLGLAIGCVPNSEFLRGSGVALGQSGTVLVDRRMRTSVPNVYAAGDVAECAGEVLGLWEPAQQKGRVAAANMVGAQKDYAPGVHYNATRLFDLDFASVGHVGDSNTTESLVDFPQGTGRIAYRKLVFRGRELVGAVMLGHPEERVRAHGRLFKRVIDRKTDVSAIRERLLDRGFDLRAWLEKDEIVRPAAQRMTGAVEAVQANLKGTHLMRAVLPQAAAPGAVAAAPLAPAPAAAAAFGGRLQTQFNLRPLEGVPGPARPATVAPVAVRPSEGDDAVLDVGGRTHALAKPLVVIGRAAESDVVLGSPEADLAHAHIERYVGAHYLRDLGSRTGTWVNGQPLVVPHRLTHGDTIAIAGVQLVYKSSASAPAKAKAPMQTSFASQARVEVRSGHSIGVSFTLSNPTLIGSSPDCTVFLQDPSVADRHAELRQSGNAWHLLDLGGGTWLENRPLAPGHPVALGEGNAIQLGNVRLVFTHSLTERAATRMVQAGDPAFRASAAPAAPIAAVRPSAAPVAARPSAAPVAAVRPSAAPVAAVRPSAAPVRPSAAPPSAASPRLRVHAGPRAGEVLPLAEFLVFGSHPGSANAVFQDPDVAPAHLEVRRYQGGTFARDLGSGGRSQVGGRPLGSEWVRLAPGEWLMLGPRLVLVYEENA